MSIENGIMTIHLAKGHFQSIIGSDSLRVDFTDFELPNMRYQYNAKEAESKLPPISDAYDTLQQGKYTESEVIDILIELYFPLKFFRVGMFEKMPLCLGFIGGRGGGKSCSAAEIASCDFLLRGLPVWSNVPIRIKVAYKDCEKIFSSQDLVQMDMMNLTSGYRGGLVFYDEVNMTAAEGSRYMSSANLQFSYAMQQIRKRMISVIWTGQGWNTVDSRLKYQSDFVIACRDVIFEKKKYQTNGLGDKSLWRNHDLSGLSGKFDYDYELKHRYLTDFMVWQGTAWLTPWWLAYDTNKIQDEDYMRNYKQSVKEQHYQEKYGAISKAEGEFLPAKSNTLQDSIAAVAEKGLSRIDCKDFYDYLNIDPADKVVTTEVGSIFSKYGYVRAGNSKSGRYWIKKEVDNGTIRIAR